MAQDATTCDKYTIKWLMVPLHDISSHKKVAHDAATTWDKVTQLKWLMVPLHEISSHNKVAYGATTWD